LVGSRGSKEYLPIDRLPEVAAVEVGVDAGELLGLVPDQRVDPELGPPVELDEAGVALGGDQAVGVDAEAVHHPQAPRDRPIRHHPEEHVGGLRGQAHEVVEGVVGRRRLRHLVVGLGLDRVDQVGELDRVLNEEDRDVVADEVEVAVVGVELDGEAADVAGGVGRAAEAGDRREAGEDRGPLRRVAEELGAGQRRHRRVDLEVAVGRRAPGVDHPLGDPLVIEVGDLLAEDEVLEERRPPRALGQGVVVVADRRPLVGGQATLGRGAIGLEVSVLALRRHRPGQ
jgi:hypothetical protein